MAKKTTKSQSPLIGAFLQTLILNSALIPASFKAEFEHVGKKGLWEIQTGMFLVIKTYNMLISILI